MNITFSLFYYYWNNLFLFFLRHNDSICISLFLNLIAFMCEWQFEQYDNTLYIHGSFLAFIAKKLK